MQKGTRFGRKAAPDSVIRNEQVEDTPNQELLKKLRDQLENLNGYVPEKHGVAAEDKKQEAKKPPAKDKKD